MNAQQENKLLPRCTVTNVNLCCSIAMFLISSLQSFGQPKGTEATNNSVQVESLSVQSFENPDSLTRLANQPSDSLAQVIQIVNHKIDSLNILLDIKGKYSGNIDSMRSKLLGRIDSLSTLRPRRAGPSSFPNTDTLLVNYISDLKSRLDSLKLRLSIADSGAVNIIGDAKSKIAAPVSKVEEKINEKLGLVSGNGLTSVPAQVSLGSVTQSVNLSPNLPSLGPLKDGQNVSEVMPDMRLGSENIPKTNIKNLLDGQTIPTAPNPQLPTMSAPNVKGINDLNVGKNIEAGSGVSGKITEASGKISELPGQIYGYSEDLASLKNGDLAKVEQLPDQIEKAALDSKHLDGLEEQITEVEGMKTKVERYSDPMVAKEQMLNDAKELAVNHFAGHEEELKAAMEKLSKLKQKFPDAEGTLDLFKKTQDPHRGKRFVERLVPGFSLQVQAPNSIWLDVTPSLFCTVTARWSAGLGWNERIAYNWENKDWQLHERIYGPRASIHFRLKPNFILKGDVETMNTQLDKGSSLPTNDATNREWVWSYFGGVKKEFQFSKKIKGNVQIMYNLYDRKDLSPYAARLNVRMGFEFSLKKQRKESVETEAKNID